MKKYSLLLIVVLTVISTFVVYAQDESDDTIQFVVIGDYGLAGPSLEAVSTMIHDWNPDFIITTGDNNYPHGSDRTIDENIGQYFHDFIYPYVGEYGDGAETNRFFPSLGNHDFDSRKGKHYLDYFELPGNERYYDFVRGPVHFFVLNSNVREKDGFRDDSVQGEWFQEQIAASETPWQIVYFHHAPYSSALERGPSFAMRWPFAEWGIDAVFSGHDHFYERIEVDGIVYFVNGIGITDYIYEIEEEPIAESQAQYNETAGAQLVTATECEITFDFYSIEDGSTLIDSYTMNQCDDDS